jgi:bifunctional non-homologous end joining protein LigD
VAGPELERYRAKRHFDRTPEPPGSPPGPAQDLRWVVQEHAARRLHYDFRLEADGVLVSWAVPKGPSYNPRVKRLAVKVEDHPLDYRHFEGTIPTGNYGSGAVIVWDEGTYRNLTVHEGETVPVTEAVAGGHLSFWLEGHKLVGGWSLTRFDGDNWALVKRKDDHAAPDRDITTDEPASVRSGRTLEEVAAGSGPAGAPQGGPEGILQAEKAFAPAEFFPPMLAHARPTTGSQSGGPLGARPGEWLLEPKLDGLRCIAVRNGGTVTLFSRNRLSFNTRFPAIVKALGSLPATNFVLDGELVGLQDGRADFGALQQGSAAAVEYWVFDLPWLLGQDLRHLPIESRKTLLAKTVGPEPTVKVVPILQGDPRQLLDQTCQEGGEGLVAKRSGSPYREGRGGDWYKLKCGCRQELVIGGFTRPSGTRSGFGALLLGYWRDGELAYAGKVGTGFTQANLKDMLAMLVPIERPSSPFATPVPERGARWVDPQMVAEVAFSNWTREGRLRHPSFLGLRPDKASEDVGREDCGPGPGARD